MGTRTEKIKCSYCNGLGTTTEVCNYDSSDFGKTLKCTHCNGSGKEERISTLVVCRYCDGSGKTDGHPKPQLFSQPFNPPDKVRCSICDGSGMRWD